LTVTVGLVKKLNVLTPVTEVPTVELQNTPPSAVRPNSVQVNDTLAWRLLIVTETLLTFAELSGNLKGHSTVAVLVELFRTPSVELRSSLPVSASLALQKLPFMRNVSAPTGMDSSSGHAIAAASESHFNVRISTSLPIRNGLSIAVPRINGPSSTGAYGSFLVPMEREFVFTGLHYCM